MNISKGHQYLIMSILIIAFGFYFVYKILFVDLSGTLTHSGYLVAIFINFGVGSYGLYKARKLINDSQR